MAPIRAALEQPLQAGMAVADHGVRRILPAVLAHAGGLLFRRVGLKELLGLLDVVLGGELGVLGRLRTASCSARRSRVRQQS